MSTTYDRWNTKVMASLAQEMLDNELRTTCVLKHEMNTHTHTFAVVVTNTHKMLC